MNYYKEIKDILIKNETYKKVKDYSKNRNELYSYYEVGRILVEVQGGEARAKYGNQLIKVYSEKLTNELGVGFAYIGHEVKIENNHSIDFLLFNYNYNCFVVLEIKATKLKAEYIGQTLKYVNYVDRNIKKSFHDKTVGVIITKKQDKFILEYCTNPNIFTTTYKLKKSPLKNS